MLDRLSLDDAALELMPSNPYRVSGDMSSISLPDPVYRGIGSYDDVIID